MKRRNATRGFTLVELSIVLVIIGLIIGGVLTGQQIIQNARTTNAVNGMQAYQAQFQTYAQNYAVLPGDDPSAAVRFPSSGLTADEHSGNGDGSISESESGLVWAHLQAAGLIKSSTTTLPPNPFGGSYSFHGSAFGVFSSTTVCMDKVPAYAAQVVDSKLDDGVGDAGSVRAIKYVADTNITTAATTLSTYSDDKTYILCARM